MARILILTTALLSCGLAAGISQAQLRGYGAPPAAREPARIGLFGGLREAREERFRREQQVATAAVRAAAQRNANVNPRANANTIQPPVGVAAYNSLRQVPLPNANPTLTPYQRSLEASRASSINRTANYGSPNLQAANPKANTGNSLLRPSPVIPAAAIGLVPQPVRYNGPGVAIRLPEDSRGVVNYLVDDVEKNVIRPGEQQVLDDKGSYIVRYSRGVTADGRSFGESRYTITEGRYRFELTATGWELYRESDSDATLVPPNRLEFGEGRVVDHSLTEFSLPEPSTQSELRRVLPPESLATEKPALIPREPSAAEPAASKSDASEEVLPAPKPRSILE
jgi:hypothetical protein